MKPTCAIDGCERPVRARGYCPTHYSRWARGSSLTAPVRPQHGARQCAVDGCDYVGYLSRGWCPKHYRRWQAHGDPTKTVRHGHWATRERRDLSGWDRFWLLVEPDGDCWIWQGARNMTDYGVFGASAEGAHRYAYRSLVGEVPKGLQLDHLCRRPPCVNPDHLEPVSARENTLRGVGPSARNAVATHCRNGHALTGENVWVDKKRNTRHCRACERRRSREFKARRKAEREAS